jgi:signal peptidase II
MENQTKTQHWVFLGAVVSLVLLLDQVTKALIVANFSLYERWTPIPLLSNFFEITYTRNTGAAFGMFQSAGNIFLVIATVASVVIIYYYRQLPAEAWAIRLALGMQMGGALGNALDRLTRGHVVDFLHVFYRPHFDYPVFNLADSFIVTGVLLLIFWLWRADQQEAKKAQEMTPAESELNP